MNIPFKKLISVQLVLLFLVFACKKKEEDPDAKVEFCPSTVAYQGETYQTIKIGDQCWFAENLRYLPSVSSPGTGSSEINNYYVYGNTSTSVSTARSNANFQLYGTLYNHQAALTACPEGWKLPSDEEWKTLELFLGIQPDVIDNLGWRGTNQASQLAGNSGLWSNGQLITDQEFGTSGFNALPGGYRDEEGNFNAAESFGFWWTNSSSSEDKAWARGIGYNQNNINRFKYYKEAGFSVRCIRNL